MFQKMVIALAVFCICAGVSFAESDLCSKFSNSRDTINQTITACSNDIDSGRFTGKSLVLRYEIRGSAYWDKGDYDRAIADFSKLIECSPDSPKPYVLRGGSYWIKGDDDGAIADYSKAIEIDPNYADAYYYRGEVYKDRGEMQRANDDYKRAGELNPVYKRMLGRE